jgi:hypothetical protein
MPITKEGKQICDGCGKNIDEQLGGCQCPLCGRLYCNECEPDSEIRNVLVRPDGPDYKKYQEMCKICYIKWQKKNRKPGTLDGYLQTETP